MWLRIVIVYKKNWGKVCVFMTWFLVCYTKINFCGMKSENWLACFFSFSLSRSIVLAVAKNNVIAISNSWSIQILLSRRMYIKVWKRLIYSGNFILIFTKLGKWKSLNIVNFSNDYDIKVRTIWNITKTKYELSAIAVVWSYQIDSGSIGRCKEQTKTSTERKKINSNWASTNKRLKREPDHNNSNKN